MRSLIWMVLLAVAPAMDGEGYMYFGPGSSSLLHVGGGGEARVYKGLGVGGEFGFLFPREEFLYGAGLLSVNTSYRWNTGTHWKVQPFATGGYSLLFRGFAENRLNFGGGLTYWMADRAGLRVEYRQYEALRYRDSIREVRFGLALR
jgi:hypothetical protein